MAGLNTRQDGPPQGGPPQNPKIRKKRQTTKVFWSNTRFLASPGRDLSNRGGIFRFGGPRGPANSGTLFVNFSAKSPSLFRPLPAVGQAPMPSYQQVRSRSSGFMWSELREAPHLAQNLIFAVFQGFQARPIILPYVKVCRARNRARNKNRAETKAGNKANRAENKGGNVPMVSPLCPYCSLLCPYCVLIVPDCVPMP